MITEHSNAIIPEYENPHILEVIMLATAAIIWGIAKTSFVLLWAYSLVHFIERAIQ